MTKKSKNIKITFFISIIMLGIFIFLFLYYSREVDTNYNKGALELSGITIMEKIKLPDGIRKPSDISYSPEDDVYAIVSDNLEIFIVDGEFSAILHKIKIEKNKMDIKIKKGDVEGITFINANKLLAMSEMGVFLFFERDLKERGWKETKRYRIQNFTPTYDIASIAFDDLEKMVYIAYKRDKKAFFKVDLDGKIVEQWDLQLSDSMRVKNSRNLKKYTISGLVLNDGYLYALSEAYSTVLKIDPESHLLIDAVGIYELPEAAGITIKDGELIIVGDYEPYLPEPQIYKVLWK